MFDPWAGYHYMTTFTFLQDTKSQKKSHLIKLGLSLCWACWSHTILRESSQFCHWAPAALWKYTCSRGFVKCMLPDADYQLGDQRYNGLISPVVHFIFCLLVEGMYFSNPLKQFDQRNHWSASACKAHQIWSPRILGPANRFLVLRNSSTDWVEDRNSWSHPTQIVIHELAGKFSLQQPAPWLTNKLCSTQTMRGDQ